MRSVGAPLAQTQPRWHLKRLSCSTDSRYSCSMSVAEADYSLLLALEKSSSFLGSLIACRRVDGEPWQDHVVDLTSSSGITSFALNPIVGLWFPCYWLRERTIFYLACLMRLQVFGKTDLCSSVSCSYGLLWPTEGVDICYKRFNCSRVIPLESWVGESYRAHVVRRTSDMSLW